MDFDITSDYHKRQLKYPYQSTIELFRFANKYIEIKPDAKLLDVCCGAGSASFYLAREFGVQSIIAADVNSELLDIGMQYAQINGLCSNIAFAKEDIYNLTPYIRSLTFDGVVLMQTLSWLKNWRKAIDEISKLNHGWLLLSSLFYEGRIEVSNEVRVYDLNGILSNKSPYNIYSIPITEAYLRGIGYKSVYWQRFNIGLDLYQKDTNRMGTYTVKTEDNLRLQFSGPLSMPWYFLLAQR